MTSWCPHFSDSQWENVQELVIACIECGHEDILKLTHVIFAQRKLLQWKVSLQVVYN